MIFTKIVIMAKEVNETIQIIMCLLLLLFIVEERMFVILQMQPGV